MKVLKKDLQSVVKSLKVLAQKTEKMAKKLEKLEKARSAKKPKPKAAVKAVVKAKPAKKRVVRTAREVTAMDKVLGIIGKSKRGANTAQIKTKTGFNDKKIWNAINRLKNQGKIRSERKGIYVVT
jgi:hypothetical protein